eukprot:3710169-Amphidinium_carterae.1
MCIQPLHEYIFSHGSRAYETKVSEKESYDKYEECENQDSRLLQPCLLELDFSGTSSLGNQYCKYDLYERYWHLHVVDTDYASEQVRSTYSFEGNNKSATKGPTTTFKNRSAEVTT